MNQMPVPTTDYGELYQILTGFIKTRLMMTEIELKIFNLLKTFRSAEDVA